MSTLMVAAGTEYWADPLKLSSEVGLPVCLIKRGLEQFGCLPYERDGGYIVYFNPENLHGDCCDVKIGRRFGRGGES
jgi:hypothetical protein